MPNPSCSNPDCDRKIYYSGVCRSHYDKARGYDRTPAICSGCGMDYQKHRKAVTTFCPTCSHNSPANVAARSARADKNRRRWPKSRVHFPTCIQCSTVFCSRTQRVLCGAECQAERAALLSRVWYSKNRTPRTCADCATLVGIGRIRCDECWEKHARQARRAQRQKRRAVERGVNAERIVAEDIYRRDGWKCGLCARPIDSRLTYPNPRSASLDHIVPISRGGDHVRANVQAAHLGCNLAKGNRVESAQQLLFA